MQAFLDWLKSAAEFISNTTGTQRSVLLGFLILVVSGYYIYKQDELIAKLREVDRESLNVHNIQINSVKDSFNIVIANLREECQREKIQFLEEKLKEYKELEQETKKAVKDQHKLFNRINK